MNVLFGLFVHRINNAFEILLWVESRIIIYRIGMLNKVMQVNFLMFRKYVL